MNQLTVIGAVIGGAAGYMLGVFLACSVLIPQANTCGLFAVFITFPLGLLGGGAAGTRLARRWHPPAALGAGLLIALIALIAFIIAIQLREWAARRRPTVSSATTSTVAPAAPQGPLRVVEVSLVSDPADYVGPCPTIFRFHGTIRVEGHGRVTYRFQRSDHPTTPVKEIDVDAASVARVESEWHLGRQPERPFEGWQTLEVLEPQPLTSERATFRMTCVP